MKAALDLLGNISRALGAVANTSAMAVPMLAISAGLFKLIRGILSFGASTPLLDAGVTLVPGLASQSRVSNNLELRRLFAQDWAKKLDLYAVMTDFEPAGIPDPWWILASFPHPSRSRHRPWIRRDFRGRTISSWIPRR